jgi:hypothetical protein
VRRGALGREWEEEGEPAARKAGVRSEKNATMKVITRATRG